MVLAFCDSDENKHAYFVDETSMERQDCIDERVVLYNPETDNIMVYSWINGMGSFKRHTLDDLIEMGYEQLGE